MIGILIERIKILIRAFEARLTPRSHRVEHRGSSLTFVRSHWWDDAYQDSFDREIEPYFSALPEGFSPRTIIDAGAATGMFAVAACMRFPAANVQAFEPSPHQRILLERNASRNGVSSRIHVNPTGLWNSEETLSFRTHGAISALEVAASLPRSLPFTERVPVIPLDRWLQNRGLDSVDLIKMDVEGAEIEALSGAQETLRRFHPVLLVQAYHTREGARTFERCAALLRGLEYQIQEMHPPSGFLRAVHRSA